jgi:hypothetical protein
MNWDGYGTVRASSGGTYLVFTPAGRPGLQPQRGYLPPVHPPQGGPVSNRSGGIVCDSFSGCDTLKGNAMLCGRNGAAFARARPALAAGKSV